MQDNRQSTQAGARATNPGPGLPACARLSLNRCNLPAALLGSPLFQAFPAALEIDGVRTLHQGFFAMLAGIGDRAERARRFVDYMQVQFRLHRLEEAGLVHPFGSPGSRGLADAGLPDRSVGAGARGGTVDRELPSGARAPGRRGGKRAKADYLRMVRGWSFDPDGREGAVLKSWVETRFGLLARYHAGPLGDRDSEARHLFMRQAAAGIYATNAIEAQLDLLYTYCQYELDRRHPNGRHLTLYRGTNRIDEHEVLERRGGDRYWLLLNNLNSFTASRERADEFGDFILEAAVPLAKVFFFNQLLPGMLKGEDEFVVIGGVYEVTISTL